MGQQPRPKITREFLRVRYGLAMAIILMIALTSAGMSLLVNQGYKAVTDDVHTIATLNSQATNSFNKIHHMLLLEPGSRKQLAEDARTAINSMHATHAALRDSASNTTLSHLDLLEDPEFQASKAIDRVIAYAISVIEDAENGIETQIQISNFITLSSTHFSHVIEAMSLHATTEQERLNRMSLYATIIASCGLTLLVVLLVFLIFLPMETSIISAHEQLEIEKQKVDAANNQNEYHARHDPLTGLPNLRAFNEAMLARARFAEHVHTLVHIDLDHFKPINDTYGHDAGDFVLKSIGEIMKQAVRQGDLVTRVGGDEFVILMTFGSTLSDAELMCERLLDAIRVELVYENSVLSVGACMGIASTSDGDVTIETITKKADEAMYAAKEFGRNCIVSYPSMRARGRKSRVSIAA